MSTDFQILDKEDFKPLYAQLSDAIIQYIREKDLKPGDPIPPESELIRQCGVSRITVRQAIQRLATEGIIQKVQGKGTFVAEPKVSQNFENVRSLEENFSQQGIAVTNILLESSVEHPTDYFTKELGLPAGSRTHKIRRLKKISGKPFCIEIRNIPLEIAQRFDQRELDEIPAVDLLNRDKETEICHINFKVRSAGLLEREAETMQVPVDTPVLIQFLTYYNYKNKPVMTGRLTFLADKVEINYEFHKDGNSQRQLLVR
jgi:GntR family transcriptional regulator